MKVTFFGTTTLLFDDGKDQILFDCHFTRPSILSYIRGGDPEKTPLPLKHAEEVRVLSDAAISTDRHIIDEMLEKHHIDRLRAIFISHTHHDHVMDAPYTANKCHAVIYGSRSAMNVGRGGDVPEDHLIEFTPNETYEIGGFKIKVLSSIHSKPNILNNDLGETIDEPFTQPALLRTYKEGGSFDFYIEAEGKKFLNRPSFNYIEGQLDGYNADVLFLGVAGMAKEEDDIVKTFFRETVEKTKAKVIVPIHWDNFFLPLDQPVEGMPHIIEKTEVVFFKLGKYCEDNDVSCIVQIPRTCIEL